MANIVVAILNASTCLEDAVIEKVMPALQAQVTEDFSPVWGIPADLKFVPKGQVPQKGWWWLAVLDNSDAAGALGYHDRTDEGLPLGKIFAGTDIAAKSPWTVTASHELLEMLVDPEINIAVFGQQTAAGGTLFSYEVCDPVESETYGYEKQGVMVSDFVYPAYFETFHDGDAQYDHEKHVQRPLQTLQGGHSSTFNVTTGGGWHQTTTTPAGVPTLAMSYDQRPRVGSRRERRSLPREQWLDSKPTFKKG